MGSAARAAAIGLTLAASVSLSGCSLLIPLINPTDEPTEQSEPRVRAGDLKELIDDEDSPDGTRFRDDFFRSTFEDAAEFTSDGWAENGGTPESCYNSFAASYLVSPDKDESPRPFINLGDFAYDYQTEGLLVASARLFDNERSASGFMDFVKTAAADCATGYSLADLKDSSWVVQGVEAIEATDLDLPPGVSVVHHLESLDPSYQIVYRDTLVQYLNTVVVITCELHAESPFGLSDCDTLAETVGERLVELAR